jgi:hypothetical protein
VSGLLHQQGHHGDKPPGDRIDAKAELFQRDGTQQSLAARITEDHDCRQHLSIESNGEHSRVTLDDAPVRHSEPPPKRRLRPEPFQQRSWNPRVRGPRVDQRFDVFKPLTVWAANSQSIPECPHGAFIIQIGREILMVKALRPDLEGQGRPIAAYLAFLAIAPGLVTGLLLSMVKIG